MKTYAQFGFPVGVPLALLQGALGAVQAGIVLATPLPQYFTGKNFDGVTKDNYAGPAWAGDRGREIWEHDGQVDLVDKPTLINVGRNDVIYPNNVTEEMLQANAITARTNRQSIANGQLGRNRDMYEVRQLAKASNFSKFPVKRLARAIGEENGKLPFNYSTFDERGVTDYTQQQNKRVINRTNKARPGR